MADRSRNLLYNSRNFRNRVNKRFNDRKHVSPRKKHELDNIRSSKDSNTKASGQHEKIFENKNVHHSSRRWDDRQVSLRPNSQLSPSRRHSRESPSRDFPSSSQSDSNFQEQQRSSRDADRYNGRIEDDSRFVPYSNNKHDTNQDEFIALLKQKIDYLNGQVEFFYQENENLKIGLNNVSNHVSGNSSSEVNIRFQNKDLERQFSPILEELASEMICENIRIEDLQNFLSSKRNSLENDLPEGELFSLDSSTIEPNENSSIPRYETSFSEILQDQDLMNAADTKKNKPTRGKSCFNCSEDHMIQNCPYQMDYRKVALARKQRARAFVPQVRYHAHDVKESDFKPGTISDELREALSLRTDQIPLFIYNMRVLNYPPGWLEEAEVEASGITLYGTDVCNDGNVETTAQNFESLGYDPDKLVDFPGFNVPPPPHFIDESELLCLPPLMECHLRSVVEQYMPIANVLPKRKRKLTLNNNQATKVQRLEEDMEVEEILDSGTFEFNPPLPKENPPPPPPEDDSLPPLPEEDSIPPLPEEDSIPPLPEDEPPSPENKRTLLPNDKQGNCKYFDSDNNSGTNTPVSNSTLEALAPLGERDKSQNGKTNEGTLSLKELNELEELQKRLQKRLKELENSEESLSDSFIMSQNSISEENSNDVSNCSLDSGSRSMSRQLSKSESCYEAPSSSRQISLTESQDGVSEDIPSPLSRTDSQRSGSKLVSLGTPSLSRHSSFSKLPDYDNFSKDVTTHLNFENLPNSVGTYQKMKKVIKKVKEKINAFMQ